MKKNLIILSLFLTVGITAQAELTHLLTCRIGAEESRQQMRLEIKDTDVESGLGNMIISRWQTPENVGERIDLDDCGQMDGPCQTYVSGGWVPFKKAELKMNVVWETHPQFPKKIISEVELHMGRSGSIAVTTMENPADPELRPGILKANVRDFHFPQGIAADCSYTLQKGPKPGMSGSN